MIKLFFILFLLPTICLASYKLTWSLGCKGDLQKALFLDVLYLGYMEDVDLDMSYKELVKVNNGSEETAKMYYDDYQQTKKALDLRKNTKNQCRTFSSANSVGRKKGYNPFRDKRKYLSVIVEDKTKLSLGWYTAVVKAQVDVYKCAVCGRSCLDNKVNTLNFNKEIRFELKTRDQVRKLVELPMSEFWSKPVHNGGLIQVDITDPAGIKSTIKKKLDVWQLCDVY